MTQINIATEDELSEAVALSIIRQSNVQASVGLTFRRGGIGYLRTNLEKFTQVARREHVFMLVDLDRVECAPTLLRAWFPENAPHQRLHVRICVREIESWILADRLGFSSFLGVSLAALPRNPDELPDPKAALLSIARRARRSIRQDLLTSRGAVASQGLGYNRALCGFAETEWSIERAAQASESLRRAVEKIRLLA